MRPQHPQSDADDRLIKMVAAILVLSIGFWLYKQYGSGTAPAAAAAPAPKAALAPVTAPAPAAALWSDGGAEIEPAEEASIAEPLPDQPSAEQQAQLHLQQEQARLAQALADSNPQPGSYVVQPNAGEIRRARCQAAKDHREAVLQQAGLNRSFDLLRQLDDQVYEACKSQ